VVEIDRDAPGPLPAWVRAVDALSVGLTAVGLFVAVTGGFRFHVGAARLSVTSPWRVLIWAVVLIIIRHALVRCIGGS
jgi:hypothetical protein